MREPFVKMIGRKSLYSGFLRLEEHEFALRHDDHWKAQKRLIVDRGDSVAALLVEPAQGLVHLVRQFRYATFDHAHPDEPGNGWLTELVAGTLEPDETPEACIIREVEEETGFTIKNPERIGCFYLSPGAFTEKLYLFAATVSAERRTASRIDGHYGVDDERIETVALPVTTFLQQVERMEIKDAKTIAAAEWLRRQKF